MIETPSRLPKDGEMIRRAAVSLVFIAVMGFVVPAAALVHPGILNSAAELNFMKSQVDASQNPWLQVYNAFPTNFLTYVPKTGSSINADDSTSWLKLTQDCRWAYGAALKWKITNTASYATASIDILNHLATTWNSISGADTKLVVSIHMQPCLEAAEIMKHVYGGWNAGELSTFTNWIINFILPKTQTTNISGGLKDKNNWATQGAALRVAIAVFTDNTTLYNSVKADTETLIRFYIGSHDSGLPPGNGFTYETCRTTNNLMGTLSGGDITHTGMGLGGLLSAAETIKHQGGTTYTYLDPADNAGLLKALQYHDQWVHYSARSTSTGSGWPCAVALSSLSTAMSSIAWARALNTYSGETEFQEIVTYNLANPNIGGFWSDGQPNTWSYWIDSLTHTNTGGAVADTTDPSTPGTPTVSVISSSQLNLSWTASTDNIGVTRYDVRRCAGAACDPTSIIGTSNTNAFVNGALAASTLYRYSVTAIDAAANDSTESAVGQGTTSAAASQPPVSGNVYYVSLSGSDSNNGSITSPFRNIGRCGQVMVAGDTCFLRGGTYTSATGTSVSGTSWDNMVTFSGYPGEQVIFNIPSGTAVMNWGYPKQYVHFKDMEWVARNIFTAGTGCYSQGLGARNFRMTNIRMHGGRGTANLTANDGFQWINNKVYDMGRGGLDHSIYISCSNGLVDGGEWYDTTGYSLHIKGKPDCTGPRPSGWIVRNVTFWNSRTDSQRGAIYFHHCGSNHQVYNNVFKKFGGSAVAIHTPNTVVYNNTFDCNGNSSCNGGQPAPATQGDLYTQAHGLILRNNIFSRSGMAYHVYTNQNPAGVLYTHNVTNGSSFKVSSAITGTFNNNLVNQNLAFVNAGNGQLVGNNYHLQSSSSIIDKGVTVALVSKDKDGLTRPGGSAYDPGAFEFGGSSGCPTGDCEPPSVPINLALSLISPTQVNLDWADSTGTPSGYNVYRDGDLIASPTPSNYANTGLTPDTTYSYAVASIDAAGNESAQGPPVQITTTAPVADAVNPTPPSGCTAAAIAPDRITASCTTAGSDNLGVVNYVVRSCTGAACTPSGTLDTTSTSPPTYTRQNLTANTTYGFVFAARDAAGNSSTDSTPVAYATTLGGALAIYRLDNNLTDASGNGRTATATGATFRTTPGKTEGTHAALFDASGDVISVPLTGFASLNTLTLAACFYSDLALTATRYIFGGTTYPYYGNRVQLYTTPAGRLALGLGSSHETNSDLTNSTITSATQYCAVVRLNTGTYTADVCTGATVTKAQGAYTQLATNPPSLCLGNNCAANTEGWRGSIDDARIENRVWTDAETSTYLSGNIGTCGAPPPDPTAPLVLNAPVLGDSTTVDHNTRVRDTLAAAPSGSNCDNLNNFYFADNGSQIAVVSCSLNATALELRLAAPPALPTDTLALTWVPTAQQVIVANNMFVDSGPGASIEERQFWCRSGLATENTYWIKAPNTLCAAASPSTVNVRLDLVNTGAASSAAQDFSLYCTDNPLDPLRMRRVDENCENPLKLCLNASGTGIADGATLPKSLPDLTGITFLTAIMKRSQQIFATPSIPVNSRLEYEMALRFGADIPRDTLYTCDARPTLTGAPLAAVTPAQLKIVGPRHVVE
jgi:Alginate lyase